MKHRLYGASKNGIEDFIIAEVDLDGHLFEMYGSRFKNANTISFTVQQAGEVIGAANEINGKWLTLQGYHLDSPNVAEGQIINYPPGAFTVGW